MKSVAEVSFTRLLAFFRRFFPTIVEDSADASERSQFSRHKVSEVKPGKSERTSAWCAVGGG